MKCIKRNGQEVEFNNEKSNAAYGIYNAEENTFKYYTAEGAETTK